MRTVLASALALVAMTSATLAEAPGPEAPGTRDSRPAGLLQLTDAQMDQIKAGWWNFQLNLQVCALVVACVQNNQQNESGNNIGGNPVVYYWEFLAD